MLVEWLMERYGWNDVWFLGSNGLRRGPFRFIGPNTCMVGVWTGPDRDLLCVRKCETPQEAEKYLSPSGWTITHAAILSWRRLISGGDGSRNSLYPYGSPSIESHNSRACQEDWSSDG